MDQLGFSRLPYYRNLDPRTQEYAYHWLQHQRLRQLQQNEKFMRLQSAANLGGNFVDYWTLTSFLDVDDSFLTNWNWNPDDATKKDGPRNFGGKVRMYFEPGSFFSSSDQLPK